MKEEKCPEFEINESGRRGKEKIDEGVLRWFGHVEKMENDRIAKMINVGECAGSRSMSMSRKR